MSTPTLNLACDMGILQSDLEVLQRFPKLIERRFGGFDSFLKFIGIHFELESAGGALEYRAHLKVSDSFRDFMRAVRAGDFNRYII